MLIVLIMMGTVVRVLVLHAHTLRLLALSSLTVKLCCWDQGDGLRLQPLNVGITTLEGLVSRRSTVSFADWCDHMDFSLGVAGRCCLNGSRSRGRTWRVGVSALLVRIWRWV